MQQCLDTHDYKHVETTFQNILDSNLALYKKCNKLQKQVDGINKNQFSLQKQYTSNSYKRDSKTTQWRRKKN